MFNLFSFKTSPLEEFRLPKIGGNQPVIRQGTKRTENTVVAGVEWKRSDLDNGTIEFSSVGSSVEDGRFPQIDQVDFHYLKNQFGTSLELVPTGATDAMLREKYGEIYLREGNTIEVAKWDWIKAKVIKSAWSEGKSAATIADEKKAKNGAKQSGYSARTVAEFIAAYNAAKVYRESLKASPTEIEEARGRSAGKSV
jgi:hypothetical protein